VHTRIVGGLGWAGSMKIDPRTTLVQKISLLNPNRLLRKLQKNHSGILIRPILYMYLHMAAEARNHFCGSF